MLRLSLAICFLILLFILFVLIKNGISSLSFDFLLTESKNFGSEGGIVYQIIGSFILVCVAAILCLPISLGLAIYKSEYIKSKKLQRYSNILIYGLNGIPSVIFGIFGLIFFVNFIGTGISWFVGSIILAIMIIPTVTLASYQALNNIPTIYRESAAGLGFTKWQIIKLVLIPQSINGTLTGLLLGMARAIGETAPIMFIATAFSGVDIPSSLTEPISSLPTHILALAQQATDSKALSNAWGAAFILICIVMIFSISGLIFRQKSKV